MVLINQFINFKIGGVTVTTTSTELNYNSGVIAGEAKETGTMVLDANKDITGINNLEATTLIGTIGTSSQPNITSLGTINNLLSGGYKIHGTSGTGLLRTDIIDSNVYLQPSLETTNGSATHLFITNYNQDTSTSARVFSIMSNGRLGVQSINPSKQVEINSSTGDNLRLTYNNMNGTASNYADVSTTSAGNLTITTSGTTTLISKKLKVNDTISNFGEGGLLVRALNNIDCYGRVIKTDLISTLNITDYNPEGVADNFTLEIYGYIKPLYSQTYTFYVSWNNGCRLFVNGELLFNKWDSASAGTGDASNTIYLLANTWYPIYIQNYEYTGTHNLRVEWESTSQTRQDIPAVNMAWSDAEPSVYKKLSSGGKITLYDTSTTTSSSLSKIDMSVNSSGNLTITPSGGNVDISSHNGSTAGLQLGGTLITSTASELNILDGVTANASELNILDGVTANTTELNYLDLTTGAGTAEASKALVLNSSSNITGINSLSATDLTGTLQTASQPNITSLGTLNFLSIDGALRSGDLSGSNAELRILDNGTDMLIQCGTTTSSNSSTDLYFVNMFTTPTTSNRVFAIKADGKVGIGTYAPDKDLEINSSTGGSLRLTYNDKSGSATNYTDFSVTSGGNLNIESSASSPVYNFSGSNSGRTILQIESTNGNSSVQQELIFKSHSAARGGGITWNTNSNTRTFLGRAYNGGPVITELRYNVDTTGSNNIFDNDNTIFTITDGGNMGIGLGSASPDELLHMGTGNIKIENGNIYATNNYISSIWDNGANTHSIGLEFDYYAGSGTTSTTHSRISFIANAEVGEEIYDAGKTTTMSVLSNGKVGIGTNDPDKDLEINNATGGTLRLTYNDSNGGATTYTDMSVTSSGYLSISSSGGQTSYSDRVRIDRSDYNALTVKDSGVDPDNVFQVDTVSRRVGINTLSPDRDLEINNPSGATMRMKHNNNNYVDFSVNSAGDLTIVPDGVINIDGKTTIDALGTDAFIVKGSGDITLQVDTDNQKVGIFTRAPDKALEINSATGNNLRLTYNDWTGSATDYVDFSVSSSGDLTINPSGNDVTISGDLIATLDTASQPNITSLGTLTGLSISNTSSGGLLTVASTSATGITGITLNTNGNDWEVGARGSSNGVPNSFYIYDKTNTDFRMVINSSGNVGIGTSNPGELLHLRGSGPVNLKIEADTDNVNENDTAGIILLQDGGVIEGYVGLTSVNNLQLVAKDGDVEIGANDNIIMTVKTSAVGIGTTSPDKTLEINSSTGGSLRLSYNDSNGGASVYGDMSIDAFGNFILNSNSAILLDTRTYIDRTSTDAFVVRKNGSGSTVFRIDTTNDRVGINQTGPVCPLHIKQTLDDSGGNLDSQSRAAIYIERSSSTNKWAIAMNATNSLNFYYGTTERGYLSNGTSVNQIDFTGQHRSSTPNTNIDNNPSNYIGLIVSSLGTYKNLNDDSMDINNAIPEVDLSVNNNDKKVFGVISDREDENETNRSYKWGNFVSSYDKNTGDERLIINSLGEGMIWVCDKNGSLDNGDYITSSTAVGYGQLQNDDLLHNYTVAKITQDCDFTTPERYVDLSGNTISEATYNLDPTNGYKCNFVGCTYHCG